MLGEYMEFEWDELKNDANIKKHGKRLYYDDNIYG